MNKNKFLFLLCGIFLITCCYGVLAATTLDGGPAVNHNYTTTFVFNCTTSINATNAEYNVSLVYNASGGAVDTVLVIVSNTSGSQNIFNNSAVDISGLSSLSTYNFSCYADNGTDQEYSTAVDGVTIDNTPPAVSSFFNTVDGTSHNGSIVLVLNISVNDSIGTDTLMGINSVYFNVTNTSGGQLNFTRASNNNVSLLYYNATLNITGLADGDYNITVYANDTELNNLNTSESITITIDNTNPTATLTCVPASVNIWQQVVCTCTGSDGALGSGIASTSSAQTIIASILGSNTVSGCTVTDNVGKTATATGQYDVTSSGGSTVSSGSSSTSWTTTHIVTKEQFTKGYTKELASKARMKIMVGNSYHHVGVKELTSTTAKIEITSDPIEATLSVGDTRKFDVDADGVYDLSVTLNSIANNKGDITILSISESVTEETIEEEEEKEGVAQEKTDVEEVESEEKSLVWLWVLIFVAIGIAVAIGYKFFLKDKLIKKK